MMILKTLLSRSNVGHVSLVNRYICGQILIGENLYVCAERERRSVRSMSGREGYTKSMMDKNLRTLELGSTDTPHESTYISSHETHMRHLSLLTTLNYMTGNLKKMCYVESRTMPPAFQLHPDATARSPLSTPSQTRKSFYESRVSTTSIEISLSVLSP
jgi:hypothetical protein